MIGKTICHFKILEKLGQGAMGIVYKAEDTKLKRKVAIKVLPQDLTRDEEAKKRFVNEARAASALDHPNVGTIYEIEETEDGQIFIVMAYYAGGTIKDRLEKGPLPVDEAVRIATDIARGLAKAHTKGVVHRDIKPANIMLTEDGQIKIVDFGLAKLAGGSQLTKTGITMGTIAYMSPEQAQGIAVDYRTDIWSLAVVLYEMLTGRLPFKGEYDQAVVYLIVNKDPEPMIQSGIEIPKELASIVERAMKKELDERYSSTTALLSDLQNLSNVSAQKPTEEDSVASRTDRYSDVPRIFLSYKRNAEPDQSVAMQLNEALSRHYDIFIDQDMSVGERWVERIMAELEKADFLVTLLSANSIQSEMVQEELKTAHNLAKQNGGRPKILPVRLEYRKAFQYPISEYLDSINWAFWEKDTDTSRIIDELRQAIEGAGLPISNTKSKAKIIQASTDQPIPQPFAQAQPAKSASLESPEGTMDPESHFYIERAGDGIAMEAIKRQGVTITIKAPRQMGKSSLLIRITQASTEIGKQAAFIDFQLFDKSALDDSDIFFQQFCTLLSDELEIEDRTDEFWKMPLGNSQRCSRYVGRYLLKELDGPLVLAMDEMETMFDTEYRSDFFSMLRNWHNSRATKPIWKQLDLALVTSTEPYQLIDNLNQSPFNVGEIIELPDFTPEEVNQLNNLHGSPFSAEDERKLVELLGGHPYLTRRALYVIASERMSADELFKQATDERGPFGDHLRYHLFRLYGKDPLIQGLRNVITKNSCPDERIFFRLRGAGLVKKEGQTVLPRCKLYAEYFREHINA
ncbi:MAG: AAA-like domain-containing protein [bacterium]